MQCPSTIPLLAPYPIGGYQFFREWFAEAWKNSGGTIKEDLPLPWKLKLVLGKIGCVRSLPGSRGNKPKLLVLCGGRPEYFSWPWCYQYEVVPVMWDCWPKYWSYLPKFLEKNNVRLIFCTSSQTAEYVNETVRDCRAVWLPEGIKASLYPMGSRLVDRPVDVLELGRQMRPVHNGLLRLQEETGIKHLYQKDKGLLFADFDALTQGLRDAKITISYPRCDTHPEMAGNIETMTQRFWECMLSGTLVAGRAPKELVDFCGYNPVIELGDQPLNKIRAVLKSIDSYQSLADKNRQFAENHADWSFRMPIIHNSIKGLVY